MLTCIKTDKINPLKIVFKRLKIFLTIFRRYICIYISFKAIYNIYNVHKMY